MRTVLLPLILSGAAAAGLAGSLSAKPARRALPCTWVHGRIAVGSGTPATRIWPVGTHRMLGVVSRAHPRPDDAYGPDLPGNVERLLTVENGLTAWGDFRVCPVSPRRAGWMQFVIVTRARRLFARRVE